MKSATRVMLFCTLALLCVASIARPQIAQPKRFTVPFAFEVDQHMMPAGTYRLTPMQGRMDVFTLSDDNTTAKVLVTADGFDKTMPRTLDSDKVVFQRYEDHYVLTQVWDAADGSAIQVTGTLPLTKAAKERERMDPNVKVIVNMDRVKK